MTDHELPDEARATTPEQAEGAPLTLFPAGRGAMSRRRFIGTGAATGAALGMTITPGALHAQEATPGATPGEHNHGAAMDMDDAEMAPQHANTNTGFVNFVPYHIGILRAACARLIPTDDTGPGAEEAGVVYFIDREIASQKYFRGRRYQSGPFIPGEATQGDQSLMDMATRFRLGLDGIEAHAQSKFQTAFVELKPDQQDEVLTDLEAGEVENFGGVSVDTARGVPAADSQPGIEAAAFFQILLNYTMAGFFSDPVHGGNHDMVGWKLIGFPGAHLSWAEQVENYNQPFEGDYISLGQYQQQIGGES